MTVLQIAKIISGFLLFSGAFSEEHKQKEFTLNFHQNDYQMHVERMELSRLNKKLADGKVTTFKFNRTCTAFNFSYDLKVDMGNKMEIITQAYKFASNEYRLFPMRYQLNVCEAMSKDIFGIGTRAITKCGNFTACPFTKGLHQICNFTPDVSHLPPLIPNGKYMWELQGLYLSEEIYLVHIYLEVSRPLFKY